MKAVVAQPGAKAQDFLGAFTPDELTRIEGTARRAAGELHERYGDVLDNCATFLQRKPRTALCVLAGVTLALAWLIKRRRH